MRRNGLNVGRHRLGNRLARLESQQAGQIQRAEILVAAIDDINRVSAVRNLAAGLEIAQHDLERDVRPHGDDIDIHQAAG